MEMKGCTFCRARAGAETKQDCHTHTGGFAPFAFGKNAFTSLGGSASTAADTFPATSNSSFSIPFGQIAAFGQSSNSMVAKADISSTTSPFAPFYTTAVCPLCMRSSLTNPIVPFGNHLFPFPVGGLINPPTIPIYNSMITPGGVFPYYHNLFGQFSSPSLQSNTFSFSNNLPSHTPAFNPLSNEVKIYNHGWKPVSSDESSNQAIDSKESFQKSTGMTSHSETPSFGCSFVPPSTTNAQNIARAPTVTDLKGPTTFSFCKDPSSEESKPSISEPFSFKSSRVGQGAAECNSLFQKPAFSFGVDTSAPGTQFCANYRGTTASTTDPFLLQYPKEGEGTCSIMSVSTLPINEGKSHEELRLENYLLTGKVKEQDEAASKVTPYPLYPFIPIMMLPSMPMLPLVPNLNAAFNVASSATSTGFPGGSYAVSNLFGLPSTHGPPISMPAIDPHLIRQL